jgi:hypothetical protein
MSRRELLGAAITLPLWRAGGRQQPSRPGLTDLRASRAYAVTDGSDAGVTVTRNWTGDICRSRLVNGGREPVRIREVVLFDLDLELPGSTAIYGESFQMLSQSGGTLSAPKDLGSYTDAKHCRIPISPGTQAYFGTVTLPRRRMLCLFNWGDTPITLSARLTRASTVSDFWTGAAMGGSRVITIPDMPAHSARLLECADV